MIWGCMTWEGVGYATKIDGRMIVTFTFNMEDELLNTLQYHGLNPFDIIFQQVMTLSTLVKRPRLG